MFSKLATNKARYGRDICFTKNARTAWDLLLKSYLSLGDAKSILLPSYIGHSPNEGSGIFDPVVSNSVKFDFYSLTLELAIDVDCFEALAKTGKYGLALVIHYFGFPVQNLDKIIEICDKHGVLCVEDCAHVWPGFALKSLASIGSKSRNSFFSLHKWLPCSTGGLLKSNCDKLLSTYSLAEQEFESETSIAFVRADFNAIRDHRRQCFELYYALLNGTPSLLCLWSLDEEVVPHSFPILVNMDIREKLYYYLMEKGFVVTALYYRLIDPLQTGAFPLSLEVSGRILNLPVHQDVLLSEIEECCSLIRGFLDENSQT